MHCYIGCAVKGSLSHYCMYNKLGMNMNEHACIVLFNCCCDHYALLHQSSKHWVSVSIRPQLIQRFFTQDNGRSFKFCLALVEVERCIYHGWLKLVEVMERERERAIPVRIQSVTPDTQITISFQNLHPRLINYVKINATPRRYSFRP